MFSQAHLFIIPSFRKLSGFRTAVSSESLGQRIYFIQACIERLLCICHAKSKTSWDEEATVGDLGFLSAVRWDPVLILLPSQALGDQCELSTPLLSWVVT